MKSTPPKAAYITAMISLALHLFAGNAISAESSGGIKQSMKEAGMEVELVYTGEVVNNLKGGAKETDGFIYLDNIDFMITLDTEGAGLWKGGTFFLYALINNGKNPSEFVGDLQVTSNIEANESVRLYEIWYEHSFMAGKLSILGGLHDMNSEFLTTDYGGLFFNSSFGIQPDVSANVPVSIFNLAAPAIRVKIRITESFTFLAAVYDGVPGDPEDNKHSLNIVIDSEKEGFMNIAEIQFAVGGDETETLPGIYKVGAWTHTGEFQRFKTGEVKSGNSGMYGIFDQMIFRETGDQGLGVFVQAGFAPDDRNEVAYYMGGGFNYTGLFPGRDEDTLGVAVAHAKISDDLVSVEEAEGGPSRTSETTWEFTYHSQINSWLAFQPDYQIVVNPGGDPNVDAANVVSARIEVTF